MASTHRRSIGTLSNPLDQLEDKAVRVHQLHVLLPPVVLANLGAGRDSVGGQTCDLRLDVAHGERQDHPLRARVAQRRVEHLEAFA